MEARDLLHSSLQNKEERHEKAVRSVGSCGGHSAVFGIVRVSISWWTTKWPLCLWPMVASVGVVLAALFVAVRALAPRIVGIEMWIRNLPRRMGNSGERCARPNCRKVIPTAPGGTGQWSESNTHSRHRKEEMSAIFNFFYLLHMFNIVEFWDCFGHKYFIAAAPKISRPDSVFFLLKNIPPSHKNLLAVRLLNA